MIVKGLRNGMNLGTETPIPNAALIVNLINDCIISIRRLTTSMFIFPILLVNTSTTFN